jgi:PAS domain S-box-containing protein
MASSSQVSAQLYQEIFENAPFGLYTLDKNGLVTSFNPKMLELSGDSAEQVIGVNALELPSYKKVGLDKYFREGLAGKPFETEVRYVSQFGKKPSIRHYRGVPIADGQTGLLLIVEDVTEQRRTETKLEEVRQEERLEHERLRLLIVVVDVVVIVAIFALLSRTRFGLRARASVRNPDLAETIGIDKEACVDVVSLLAGGTAANAFHNSRDLARMALEANARVPRFVIDSTWDRPTHPEFWYFRSDHVPYARHGIPAVYFSTLPHALYHTPSDEPASIDVEKVARVARWMYATGWAVATTERRPAREEGFRLER